VPISALDNVVCPKLTLALSITPNAKNAVKKVFFIKKIFRNHCCPIKT
jgi:hypothetical protein